MATQALPSLPLHKLDIEIYNRMVASGALEGEPVELLEGWLVDVMSPQSPGHATIIERLTRILAHSEARLRIQLPLEVPPDSEPEPDLALIAGPPSPAHHPRTALLVVEVSINTHAIDRGVKADLYAKAGVLTYWLVDVPGKAIEVRSDPGQDGYRRCDIYAVGMAVPSPAQGVSDLDVGELLQGVGD
jgi:Uma2 family endonuclease